jgi:anti-anti-sigma regulatory factor
VMRITLVPESKPPTLKLEGKLSGPWVNELQHSWNEIRQSDHLPKVAVDLTEVTFVSPEGKQLLEAMFQQGADLRSRSLMTQFILGQIKNNASQEDVARNGGSHGVAL